MARRTSPASGPAATDGQAVSGRTAASGNIRAPRVGELIAAELRPRILDGSYTELPTQDVLIREFGVSYPSVREALRILETEGLITVRRGVSGGAMVHRPSSQTAGYSLSLLLESEHVQMGDLAKAISIVEPACASLCAEARNHARIADALDRENELAASHVNDGAQFTRLARRFHDQLIEGCSNRTLSLIAGVLGAVWAAHEQQWAEHAQTAGSYPRVTLRNQVVNAHRHIAAAVRAGDVERTRELTHRHVVETQQFVLRADRDRTIESSALRNGS